MECTRRCIQHLQAAVLQLLLHNFWEGGGGFVVLPRPPLSIYALTLPRDAHPMRRTEGQLVYVVGRGGGPPLPFVAQRIVPCPPAPRGTEGG